jgi:hypothetical protein
VTDIAATVDRQAVDQLGRALVVLEQVAARLTGDNQTLDLVETTGIGTYVSGSAVTTAAEIALGNPGAAGNKLYGIAVYNNSGSAFTACTLKDGATTLDFLTLGMTTLASGSYATWTPPGGVLESKNGGWKLVITCAGTMSSIKYGAVVAQ